MRDSDGTYGMWVCGTVDVLPQLLWHMHIMRDCNVLTQMLLYTYVIAYRYAASTSGCQND